MNQIQIIGFKGTGSRAVPSLLYFGRSNAQALQAARDRCHENWSSMVMVKNPRGRKVPFRTMRAESFTPPPSPGLFLPPGPTEDPPAETETQLANNLELPPLSAPMPAPRETETADVENIIADRASPQATHKQPKNRKEPTRKPR